MRHKIIVTIAIVTTYIISGCAVTTAQTPVDLTEEMRQSLVYLEISAYRWDWFQPWRSPGTESTLGYACAVGPYQVLTTASNVINASLVKARRYAKNEFIPAEIVHVDYEMNLCLIRLDKDSMDRPLVPVFFTEEYTKGEDLRIYWLSSGGHLTDGRAFLDRAEVFPNPVSFNQTLNYVAGGTSDNIASGKLYTMGSEAIGLAQWVNSDAKEAGLIPAETINRFLADIQDGRITGFASTGFETQPLLDPTVREHLHLPERIKHGTYVSQVYTLGTGSKELKADDVILSINGKSLNPYGRYQHPDYDRISYEHIIHSTPADQTVEIEIWRDGQRKTVRANAEKIESEQMLVPYHHYDKKPQYFVSGGYVFIPLTRDYLTIWGENWSGKVPAHLYHYYRKSLEPESERKQIIVLSYVLPAMINQGYQGLGRIVLEKVNGQTVTDLKALQEALNDTDDGAFHVLEFEMNNPSVIIPKKGLGMINDMIQQSYGIGSPSNF